MMDEMYIPIIVFCTIVAVAIGVCFSAVICSWILQLMPKSEDKEPPKTIMIQSEHIKLVKEEDNGDKDKA
jgi:hypothetical protein